MSHPNIKIVREKLPLESKTQKDFNKKTEKEQLKSYIKRYKLTETDTFQRN